MKTVDIVIAGGGLVGSCLAIALASSALNIILIDTDLSVSADTDHSAVPTDGRSLALSYASQQFLSSIQLWEKIQPFATAILTIHVSAEKSFGKTVLSSQELGLPPFGYVVPISCLIKLLKNHLCQNQPANLQKISAKITDIQHGDNWQIDTNHSDKDYQQFQAKLLIATDGEHSFIREKWQLPVRKKDYQQTAFVSTASISRAHHGTAYQRLTQRGVLAVMPLQNHRVGLILTADQSSNADITLTQADFLSFVQTSMGYRLGKFSDLGKIYQHPLKSLHLEEQVYHRWLIFLGNAAHVLHPIAAQGLNLSLRDIALLASILNQISSTQSLMNIDFHTAYYLQRQQDQLTTEKFTENLLTIFSYKNGLLTCLRSLGLTVFDLMTPAKYFLCQRRMGL